MFERVKTWARTLKRDGVAVYFAARHPDTPTLVRVLALFVAAYALSPIDLIPDFIPVLGYLDDLIIVPLGLLLVIRFTPPHVMEEARARANVTLSKPKTWWMAALFVALWLACAVAFGRWLVTWLRTYDAIQRVGSSN
jgi:uncharacterized membrane protein YkvA (DUF1232 family)